MKIMKKLVFSGLLMATVLLLALVASPVLGGGNGNGPPDDDPVKADPVRGKPVKVDGKDMKLWVFVHPERGGKGKKPPKDDPPSEEESPYCTDGNQTTTVPKFANARSGGLTFNINATSIPGNQALAIGAIHASFDAWDKPATTGRYFTVNNSGGANRPAADGNNSVGWVKIVPRSTLAAAWVWVDDATGKVDQVDVFYNAFHKWGVFTACDAEGKFEVGNIGTHEFGHVVGLDHLSDPNAFASLYPTAPKGEVRKQTLTTGDENGYTAAGAY